MQLGFKKVQPGEGISAAQQNEIVKFLASVLRSSGANFFVDSQGLHMRATPAQTAESSGLPIEMVRVASTANIPTMEGLMTIDGIVLAAGDLVLTKNQSTADDRGIWIVKAAVPTADPPDPGAWQAYEPFQTEVVFVREGALSAKTFYMLTAANVYSGGSAYYA
jgi:hypothetical protein